MSPAPIDNKLLGRLSDRSSPKSCIIDPVYVRLCSTILILVLAMSAYSSGQSVEPVKLLVGDVELHYIEKGTGEPLILLHGGLFDYRSWEPQFEVFAKNYRVISYSRRYSFPNKNETIAQYRPGLSDADDLKGLIKRLGLTKVHLVGLSYGAFVGLLFATENPDMVASMVLAEPPAHQVIRDLQGGEQLYQDFLNQLKPMVEAFRRGDNRAAMISFNQSMGRDMEKLPTEAAKRMMQNAPALKAINLAPEPFPAIKKRKLRRLAIPTLMVKGETADRIHAGVADELSKLIPGARSVVVPGAGHNTPRDNPGFFNQAVLDFLGTVRARVNRQ